MQYSIQPLVNFSSVTDSKEATVIVLFATDPIESQENTGNNLFKLIPEGVACIGVYLSNPPSVSELTGRFNLRDLICAESVEQIVFALNREIDTLLLKKELQRKSDLLQLSEISIPEPLSKSLIDKININSGYSTFPTWVLNRHEFIKYLDEHIYIL
ncbi:hypothetical protein L0152_32780, partial [bacterium]|nr:hypothetical protein [bacterium]